MACTPDFGNLNANDNHTASNITSNDNHTASNITSNGTVSFFSDDDIAQLAWFMKAESIINKYIASWICAFGILGNIFNLLVLTRKSVFGHMSKRDKSVYASLIALAMSDLLYCTWNVPEIFKVFRGASGPGMNFWVFYDAYGYAFINCFLLSSTWLTVAMAVCRYVAICHPLRALQLRQYLGMKASRVIIVTVFCLSILFCLPRFWMQKIEYVPCKEGGLLYFVENSFMKKNETARMTYMCLNFTLGILLPLLVLIYSNVFLVKALNDSSVYRQKNATCRSETTRVATLTLCIIVILDIVLVVPAEVITFWVSIVDRQSAVQYGLAVKICNTLQLFNFAINFILYFIINVHFRRVMKNILCCQAPRSSWATLRSSLRGSGTSTESTMMLPKRLILIQPISRGIWVLLSRKIISMSV